jgi:hypothetical protein
MAWMEHHPGLFLCTRDSEIAKIAGIAKIGKTQNL